MQNSRPSLDIGFRVTGFYIEAFDHETCCLIYETPSQGIERFGFEGRRVDSHKIKSQPCLTWIMGNIEAGTYT